MKSAWTKHLKDPADKKALELSIKNSGTTLDALGVVLKGKHKTPKLSNYDSPSWPYLRAEMDGYNRALEEILDLINIKDGVIK